MRLTAPSTAPALSLIDIYDKPVTFGVNGKKTLLCFFRDAACPFCIYRVVELTQNYVTFSALGLEIVAIFTSTPSAVRRFVTRHYRPFRLVADTSGEAHKIFRIERSTLRKLKGLLTRIPTLLKGLRYVGLAGLNTTNLMPAEFLLDENGQIIRAHYGKDPGDRLPLAEIELILAQSIIANAKKIAREDAARSRLTATARHSQSKDIAKGPANKDMANRDVAGEAGKYVGNEAGAYAP